MREPGWVIKLQRKNERFISAVAALVVDFDALDVRVSGRSWHWISLGA